MAKKKEEKNKKKASNSNPAQPIIDQVNYAQKQYKTFINSANHIKNLTKQITAPIDQYKKIFNVIPVEKSEYIEADNIEDDLYELKKFIPIELNPTTQDYIDKLLDNMGANSNFFNNAVLNLSHFYIFCLHGLLVKIYRNTERFKHLQYLKEITKKPVNCELNLKDFEHNIFNRIEPEAIVFLFYYLEIDSHSHIFQRNTDIFNARHEIAHFNEKIFSYDKYQEVRTLIESNLSELFHKAYKYMKESLCAEIIEYNNSGSLDNQSYEAVFEEINQRYYITYFDYEMLANRLTSHKPKTNYYILKYVVEQLGIEKQ